MQRVERVFFARSQRGQVFDRIPDGLATASAPDELNRPLNR
ncbi:MAG: hypothetical protein JWN04_4069, partial [Myxococcaceae bacterium]|nr:hypothetical protein [Myxococcaceae bacterium]